MVNFEDPKIFQEVKGKEEMEESLVEYMSRKIKITGEELGKVIDMVSGLRDECLSDVFLQELREAQKSGDIEKAEMLKSDGIAKLESMIDFISVIEGEEALGRIRKGLEETKEYIIQKF